MNVHLLDGTYELFRHYYAVPSHPNEDGEEVGALIGVLNTVLSMIRDGATHVGVATDHVIESFRNELYAGYKTGEGIDPALWRQFHPLEDALRAMGFRVWAMIDQEADDALAAAALRAYSDERVERIFICTPDKDLAQCVNDRIVQLDRRTGLIRDTDGVREKFGVHPQSIPDYLALVGDSSDGYPGIPGWGSKSASGILSRYPHLEAIPRHELEWEVRIRGAMSLAASLRNHWDDALLYRKLATLRYDAEVFESIDELEWKHPREGFARLCEHMRAPELVTRAAGLARA
jgi:5'-3' exonuclease